MVPFNFQTDIFLRSYSAAKWGHLAGPLWLGWGPINQALGELYWQL